MKSKANGESHYQLPEREEIILFFFDFLGLFGLFMSLWIMVLYVDIDPFAFTLGNSTIGMSIGFTSERGAFSAQMPAVVRKHIWWMGPAWYVGIYFVESIDEGTLSILTYDAILRILLVIGSWWIDSGFKRLLVRGRFMKVFRGMVEKKGNDKVQVSKGLLIMTLIFVSFIILFTLLFDTQNLLQRIAFIALFMGGIILCVGSNSEDVEAKETKLSESDDLSIP